MHHSLRTWHFLYEVLCLQVIMCLLQSAAVAQQHQSPESPSLINCSAITSMCRPTWYDSTTRFSCNRDLDRNIFRCVPDSAVNLDLSESFFGGSITSYSLQHLTHLETLTLRSTNLRLIENGAFHNLYRLRVLDLSWNNLTHLPIVLFEPLVSLNVLNITANNISKLSLEDRSTSKTFKSLTTFLAASSRIEHFMFGLLCGSPNLTEVNLYGNFMQFDNSTFHCAPIQNHTKDNFLPMTLDVGRNYQDDFIWHNFVFTSLRNLHSLDISRCHLFTIEPMALEGLVNLRGLYMDNNVNLLLPRFIRSGESMVPELSKFSCSFRSPVLAYFSTNFSFEGLHKIEDISLANNNLRSVRLIGNFSQLIFLNLGGNPLDDIGDETFVGMSDLSGLYLDGLYEGTVSQFETNIFDSLDNIYFIRMNRRNVHLSDEGRLIRNLCKLYELDLHDNYITHIPKDVFRCMGGLTLLDLSNNQISTWDPDTFLGIQLELFDVSKNSISIISLAMLSNLSPEVIKAGGNPYACTCGLQDFVVFMRDSARTHLETDCINDEIDCMKLDPNWPNHYKCSSPASYSDPEYRLTDYQPSIIQCRPYIIWVCVCLATLLLLGLGAGLAYRKRWYIRHWTYLFRILRSRRRALKEASREYDYEAFVSYSTDNQLWVEAMMQRIESDTTSDVKLFVPGRDSRVGRFDTVNIVEGVEASRKTVVILSKHYARSKWCEFEMNIAHTKQVKEGRDFLLLIVLEPVGEEDMTKTLRILLSNNTYLEWTEDKAGQKLFWRRLMRELERPALAPPRVREADEDDCVRDEDMGTLELEREQICMSDRAILLV